MQRIFKIKNYFLAPDGTLVSPFLNSKDSESGLTFDLLDNLSIAAGEIEAGSKSRIHVMQFVSQVTFVRKGNLVVRMHNVSDKSYYELELLENVAVLSKPGGFFQLINRSAEPCYVLYIVSPSYVFEMDGDKVIFDDSIILEEDWDALEKLNWLPPALKKTPFTLKAREESLYRLKKKIPGV